MKSTIKTTALGLMSIYGKATTLEVKNAIHAQRNDPNFVLTQYEVSQLMREIAREEGWKSDFNGRYIEYSLLNVPATSVTATKPVATTTQRTGSANIAVKVTQPTYSSVNVNHPMVGYLSGNPNFYITGLTKNEVRRAVFLVATSPRYDLDITYDDINYCSADHFFKKYHS